MKRIVIRVEDAEAAKWLAGLREILVQEAKAARTIYAPRSQWLQLCADRMRLENCLAPKGDNKGWTEPPIALLGESRR